MGRYINPKILTKEEWLHTHGTPVRAAPLSAIAENGCLPVCLVDNGPFTAAGICYNDRELKAFQSPDDWRLKEWYMVPVERLLEVCPELADRLNP